MAGEKEKNVLSVFMLGKLSISYQGKPLTLTKSMSSKLVQIFLILINTKEGVSRDELIRLLYGNADAFQAGNSLRAMIFRLRKGMIESGLPQEDYIINRKGMYRWESNELTLYLDVEEFQQTVEAGLQEKDCGRRKELLQKADQLYVGEFVPEMIGDEWATVMNRRYQKLYFAAMRELLRILKDQKDYREVLKCCEKLTAMYPYEEWQLEKLDCLCELEEYKHAFNYCEEIAEYYQREFGMDLSAQMQKRRREIAEKMDYEPGSINEIQNKIMDSEFSGGETYRNYLAFTEIYRYMAKALERSGQSAYLMLYTITDKERMPLEREDALEEVRKTLMESIDESIRRSDVYTQYGKNQFLILLLGINEAGCEVVVQRIQQKFQERNRRRKVGIFHTVSSILDVKPEMIRHRFDMGQMEWK